MFDANETVAEVYNLLMALRARCAELTMVASDPNVNQMLKELHDQHTLHAAEISLMLTDAGAEERAAGARDTTTGHAQPEVPGLPDTIGSDAADLLPGLERAEEALVRAYDAAIAEETAPPMRSMLERQRVIMETSLGRIGALAGVR